MRTLAVVPIKGFSTAKRRLADTLADGARASLVQAMLADVLSALRRVRAVDSIAVVTADAGAASLARGDGAMVIGDEREAGQSEATLAGIAAAVRDGYERALLVPGDTPLLDPDEIDDVLAEAERRRLAVTIVPDRHGTGTNALAIAPPDAFRPSFGPGSHTRHLEAARAGGLSHDSVEVRSLALDVDTGDDLAALTPALAAARRAAPRTRGALTQLERSGALRQPIAAPGASG